MPSRRWYCLALLGTSSRSTLGRAMMQLDRSSIRQHLDVVGLRIPAKRTGEVLSKARPHLLNVKRMRNVMSDENDRSKKVVLLSHSLAPETLALLLDDDMEVVRRSVELDYEYFTAEEAMRMALPASVEVPTAFETAGHLVHLNLKAEQLEYKNIIGQVILDKLRPRIRTVVTKTGDVAATFRTFPLEVIAGEDDTNVIVREENCEFAFDFRKVYWNSRLQSEHSRLAGAIAESGKNLVVADATCGVGPFAVPLALAGVTVHANDINPAAVEALRSNSKRNKCLPNKLKVHGPGCARTFLTDILKDVQYHHVITNLPASGIELLDAFDGGFRRGAEGSPHQHQPIVHCYCFAAKLKDKGTDTSVVDDISERVRGALGAAIPPPANEGVPFPSPQVHAALSAAANGQTSVRWIRNVAPNKDMYCVSFRLSSNLPATLEAEAATDDTARNKRQRT